MKTQRIHDGIDQLTIDVKDILFEGLWEMPNGVTLNSYIVHGDDIAIIDGVCGWDGVPETLFQLFDSLNLDVKKVKYLILNHLEPDHSGWIEPFKKIHSDFEVVCTDKGAELYRSYYGDNETIHVVKDGSELDLGNGKKLNFITIPHVHWPDAMLTYEVNSQTVFSCDAFGMFGTYEKSNASEYTVDELKSFTREIDRYYSNIIGAFSPFVLKAIEKCEGIEISKIAPGHGLLWDTGIDWIIEKYRSLANCQKGGEQKISLIWGSMYGMTEAAVKVAESVLKASGISYEVHRVPDSSWGEVLTSVWTSKGVILAMPTYEYKMFPPMAAVLEEIGRKKAHCMLGFRFGSFGWSGGAQKELDEILEKYRMNWTFIEPHEFKGRATDESLEIVKQQTLELIELVKQCESAN